MSISTRLARALERLDLERRCPGPVIQFFEVSSPAELDTLRPPETCDNCGQPLAGHPGVHHIVVVRNDADEAGPGAS